MFAKASRNLVIVPFDYRRSLAGADRLGRSAGFLDLLHRRLGKMVGLHRYFARQLPRAQDLQTVTQLLDDAQLEQAVGVERIAFQFLQLSEFDNGVMLFEDVRESALGQPAVNRHLAAFETALLAEPRAGALTLRATRRGLAMSRAHATADALAGLLLSDGRSQSAEVHRVSPITPPLPADAESSCPCPGKPVNPAAPPPG